jgi:hypothetical protein
LQEGCVHKVHDRVASNASVLIGVGIGKQKRSLVLEAFLKALVFHQELPLFKSWASLWHAGWRRRSKRKTSLNYSRDTTTCFPSPSYTRAITSIDNLNVRRKPFSLSESF